MKSVLLTLCFLVGAFWWACAIETPHAMAPPTPAPILDDWRRTADGWERRTHWSIDAVDAVPSAETVAGIHPLLLAALQTLISCGALFWFDPIQTR